MPAARGQHLFTRTKRHLMDWATEHGLAGMYSEATAAHPYSQRANLELGAHETGFLLGWIPASVSNDAATDQRPRRQSAALFYTKLNDGHERDVYAPERHHEIIRQTLELCELRGTLADPPTNATIPERTELHVEIDADHNLALITAHTPGADLEEMVAAERHHLFHSKCVDAIYLDLPLEDPATALLADHLERLGVSYAGVFPNNRTDGDVSPHAIPPPGPHRAPTTSPWPRTTAASCLHTSSTISPPPARLSAAVCLPEELPSVLDMARLTIMDLFAGCGGLTRGLVDTRKVPSRLRRGDGTRTQPRPIARISAITSSAAESSRSSPSRLSTSSSAVRPARAFAAQHAGVGLERRPSGVNTCERSRRPNPTRF
jgi:hypothetical protein